MSQPQLERGVAMVARVRLESAYRLGEEAARKLAGAVAAAIGHREPHVSDDHDSRYLHPARTVLILLSDAGLRATDALAAAAFLDSIDTPLAAPPELLESTAGTAARLLAAQLEPFMAPLDPAALIEALVTADADVACSAIAERLDHARHLHFRMDLDWHTFHAAVETAWIPAARRISPPLARRFARWADAFGRRRLPHA